MSKDQTTITFRSGQSLGFGTRLPLAELGGFLDKLEPLSVRLEVIRSRKEGVVALLCADFAPEPDAGTSRAEYFRQAVARLEGELDYEATWGDANWFSSDETWLFLEPEYHAGFLASGKPIGVVFEPSEIADSVFELATLNDIDIYMGVELTRTGPNAELVRHLVPALAEVDGNASQGELATVLSDAVRLGKAGGWTAREFIGLPEGAGVFRNVIEASIKERFRKVAPFLPEDFLAFEWTEAPFQDELLDDAARIGALRATDYLWQVFSRLCAPGAVIAGAARLSGTLALGAGIDVRERPQPGRYAFVSYSHRNREFVDRLVTTLKRHDMAYWYDDGIAPGSTWDETLESRIRGCSALLACVSDDYQASKYCRRELKFADLLHKPIVPVSPGPWGWGEGLQMMFQEYQVLDVQESDGWSALIAGLSHHVSSAKIAPQ